MARRVFYSFHYVPDNWRASQIRNMGSLEGNRPVTDNEWESITRGGDKAIERWITSQLYGKSCAVVLIGQGTANRKWINYEIKSAWENGKGVLGVYIHNLRDARGDQCGKGLNPFDYLTFNSDHRRLSSVIKAYDPPYVYSNLVYKYISDNLAGWVDAAVEIRKSY